MKYLCVMLLISAACSAPIDNAEQKLKTAGVEITTTTKRPHVVEILDSSSSHNMDGSYSFHFRGADGTFREETAVVKNAGTEHQYLEITGAYSFIDADGKEVVVHYKADDRGFVPEGNNIPEAISLAAKSNSELPSLTDSEEDDMFKETKLK
ncbi:cuticular protein 78E [Musca autumnalis]|uniref:cuticular protein 78E n=1 Tax=Musca autumnalis TaxID=221902 RepID=UPI003CF97CF0